MNIDGVKQSAITFLKSNWKYLIGLAAVLALLYFGHQEYQQWKQQIIDQAQKETAPQTQTITLPPQVVHTNTETIREVVVQTPSTQGAVLQFVERQGKVIAIVNGQETEVPNLTGQPDVKIGENGELRFSTMSTTKIDVTDMANAQARLIANQELEKQAKVHQKEMDKEKSARKKERIEWIIGTVVGSYLLTK
ncbi:hypothetical protein [Sporomusa sp. KB1]|jgi:hypothetical protein|uniref:hypothetical protein n=1 Tax=Sporomusa sp. KB1 TaxID=943346 RepID=UPI0011AD80DD|nr:hypothetical protein [Sporomusa sp. KB1]TWH45882.1 hypothetical protein Salpa_1814 [Sporomusa sp. KB1]